MSVQPKDQCGATRDQPVVPVAERLWQAPSEKSPGAFLLGEFMDKRPKDIRPSA